MANLPLRFSKILQPFLKQRFLLAVSGGKDSIALLHLYLHMRAHFKVQFAVAYIHHGEVAGEQGQYRNQALRFVHQLCQLHKVDFYTNGAGQVQVKGTENEWRQLRYAQLEKLSALHQFHWIVLAHHAHDQMETRLMRLIRGTGEQGLGGMGLVERNRFRPLLEFQPTELVAYLQEINAQWLDDPSNFIPDGFRNWLRNHWLPILEDFRPGSLDGLARSLELLAGDHDDQLPECIDAEGLILAHFYPLSRGDKQRVIARFMNCLGLDNYGMSHIKEVLKRLDSSQKDLTFALLRREWKIDAGRLKVFGPG